MTGLRLHVDLPHPRGLVWRALIEARLLSEWFQPVVGWRVFPTDELPSFAPFDLELVSAEPPRRLVQQWRGDDFLSEVTWELTTTREGCRISLNQTGFLGSEQAGRRDELLDGYRVMLQERLPATMERLAQGAAIKPLRPRPRPTPGDTFRLGLLSLIGAMILVVLTVTASAVWLHRGQTVAAEARPSYGLGTGTQPGVVLPPTTPTPSPSRPSPAHRPTPSGSSMKIPSVPLVASYRTVALLGLGGFDTEITVRSPSGDAHRGWSVVLTMADETPVQNRSPGVVTMRQDGQTVTLAPVEATGEVTFVVRVPALLALGKSIEACTIDGKPCARR